MAAVPAIRGKLIEAVRDAKNARTVRDRHARFATAHAYATALQLLRKTPEWMDGIEPTMGVEFSSFEIAGAVKFLGGNELLGKEL